MREMKDSGIDWIGQIPKEWNIIRAKNIFKNHKDIVGEKEDEYERLALTLNGVLKRPKDDIKGLQSESLSTYQILNEKELVFKMIDLANINTSRVGYSPYTGIVSPVYIIFNNDKYTKFGFYYFYNMWQREIFNNLGNDGVRSALNASDMLNLPFPNITFDEANKIAKYLDKKIVEIDNVIEKTKKTIEDYKKYKESIITNAITQGLDNDVETKSCNIEWVNKIPKHWKEMKLKNKIYVRARLGWKGLKAEEYVEQGYPLLSAFNIINSKLSFHDVNYINKFRYDESPEIKLRIGDILLVKDGAGIGKCALVEELGQYKKSLIYEYVTGKKEVNESKSIREEELKQIKINCKDNIFAQAILLCKVIEKLNKYNLGRVKAEKTLYLIEKDIGFDFDNNYVREVAGPLSESIYICESVISKKNKWIKVNKVKRHIEYEILSDFNKYSKYYEKYYSDYDDQIERIIEKVKYYSTDKSEMVATLYASWNDFLIKNEEISDLKIVKDVRENWNDSKKRFNEQKWLDVLEEMKQIELTPKGKGNLTIIKEN